MLLIKPCCECCGTDLPPHTLDAMICSFECTFCRSCSLLSLQGICPNCRGELVARPRRPARLLTKYPPATERQVKDGGCGA